jgi:hypothetical protein
MPLSQRTDAEELERLRQQQAQAELRDELERLRRASSQATARLKRRERSGASLHTFAATDIALDEPWVVQADRVAGHLFDLDDDAQVEALDQGWVASLSLADALQRPWTKLDQRQRWHDAFIGAMNQGIAQAEAWQAASRDDVLASAWDEVAAPPVTPERNPF